MKEYRLAAAWLLDRCLFLHLLFADNRAKTNGLLLLLLLLLAAAVEA
jgi:hypothetical protein